MQSPRTFLPPAQVLTWMGRIVSCVNAADPRAAIAEWPRGRTVPTVLVPRLQRALREHCLALAQGHAGKKSLLTLVGLCRVSTPMTVSGQLVQEPGGEQRLLPLEFESVLTEVFVAAGDMMHPAFRSRVLRCACHLYAGKCAGFLIRKPVKGPGDRPTVMPEHRLLERERRWLNRGGRKARAGLLAQFQSDVAAREEARRLPSKR